MALNTYQGNFERLGVGGVGVGGQYIERVPEQPSIKPCASIQLETVGTGVAVFQQQYRKPTTNAQ